MLKVLAIVLALVSGAVAVQAAANDAPLEATGFRSSGPAEVAWLSDARFVVARNDGSVAIYESRNGEPVLKSAFVVPGATKGVEGLVRIDAETFVTSSDHHSFIVWRETAGSFAPFPVTYSEEYGVVHSGALLGGKLVLGHQAGVVTVWHPTDNGRYAIDRYLVVRAPNRVDQSSPGFPDTYHDDDYTVRGIAASGANHVVTASEDGDLVLIDVDAGKEVSRIRYNPAARHGLNAVAVEGNLVVAGNCPSATTDHNVYTFRIRDGQFERLDAVMMFGKLNPEDKGIDFVASVAVKRSGDHLTLYAASEKGFMWSGSIDADGHIALPIQYELDVGRWSPAGVMALSPDGRQLAVAAYNVRVYKADSPQPAAPKD